MSDHETQLEAGSDVFNGPRQIYRPNSQVITDSPGGEAGSVSAVVRVPVPSSQTRIKLSIIFFPTNGQAAPNLAGASTIWVSAKEQDQDGRSGSGGLTVPVTDVEGTQALPTGFPASSGLLGYSRTFVTDADWLEAQVSLNRSSGEGVWVLQTSIQPNGVIFPWRVWDQIRRAFVPQVDGL